VVQEKLALVKPATLKQPREHALEEGRDAGQTGRRGPVTNQFVRVPLVAPEKNLGQAYGGTGGSHRTSKVGLPQMRRNFESPTSDGDGALHGGAVHEVAEFCVETWLGLFLGHQGLLFRHSRQLGDVQFYGDKHVAVVR
jgi:hypothetical protein